MLRLATAPSAKPSSHVIPSGANPYSDQRLLRQATSRVAAPITGRRKDLGGGPASPYPEILSFLAPPGTRLLLFAGKGGTGKTTCAAAAALLLAERDPARPVLLLSTDPAHSLADVLGTPLDDSECPVPGAPPNLRARELDAPARYRSWRRRLQGGLDELLGAELALDRAVVEGLLEVDPPGLDELVAILDLADLAEGDGERLVVLDTAPTGHALRLLEMPALALAWDHALLAILLKYREVLGLGELAAELVELARGLKRLQAVLTDPARTRCVAVARAAELPRRETGRLLAALAGIGVAAPIVLVNALTPRAGCARCRRAAAAERRQLAALGRELPAGAAMIRAPAAFPPPRGAAPLAAWGRSWSWSESTP
ncbi:MAG TPA: ArsA family ATPase [Thermoanaerobaculia bacterium]|nr:ArsA family ATPase [Thermoanaerobaculia bacterium]